jgi:hypothetical protein
MKLSFEYQKNLPMLAWCARFDRRTATTTVSHGANVEIREGYFYEGAWNEDSDHCDFLDATIFCGTGGKLADGSIRFSGGTDKGTPLFSIQKPEAIFISNSAIFVMSAAGERPDTMYPFYHYDLLKIYRAGQYCQDGSLRLDSKTTLHIHYSTIMSIEKDASISFATHPPCPCPTKFETLLDILTKTTDQLFVNAMSSDRSITFTPISTISRGYDAVVGAVLARNAGFTEALTFTDSRAAEPDKDSGTENARDLGMTCIEIDLWDCTNLDIDPIAEFSMPCESSRITFAASDALLSGRLLVVGNGGDSIWDKFRAPAFDRQAESWARHVDGSLTFVEFRLRVGFIFFAPPYVGVQHNQAIYQITMSSEMAPWSVEGDYDRPIPRRIGEDAGLARQNFGFKKMAKGHALQSKEDFYSEAANASYTEFIRERDRNVPRLRYWFWRSYWTWLPVFWKMTHRNFDKKYVKSSRLQRRFPFLLNAPPQRKTWKSLFTFQWAFERLESRYKLVPGSQGQQERVQNQNG